MVKNYECIGILPLEFVDGQQVEAGESFTRDFEATTGVEHEQWLIQLGHIRLVGEVSKTPARAVVVPPAKDKE